MITALDKNTALVLIDLQNGVISVGTVHPVSGIIEKANELINTFRSKELPIVIVNVKPVNSAWTMSRKDAKSFVYPDDENIYKITDNLNKSDNDIFITKHTWNAFFETSLHDELKKRSVTGIVLGGVSTSIGVEGTARAASELGYNISFALDAMTDREKEAHDRSVKFIFPRLGEAGNSTDIIRELDKL